MSKMTKIKRFKVSHLSSASFNPPSRTTSGAISSLKLDIEINGVLSPPHVLEDGTEVMTVDGHRRLECCRALGITEIDCIVHDGGFDRAVELWAALNSKTRSVNGKEWMCFWYQTGGKAEKSMPPAVVARIKDCFKILGSRDGIALMIENAVTPSAGQMARQWNNLFSAKPGLGPAHSAKKILEWMIRHQTYSVLQRLASGSSGKIAFETLRRVYSRIGSDRPATMSEILEAKRRSRRAA